MEEWRDIEGYEGLYQVSNLGRVKSLERETPFTNRWGQRITRTRKEFIMKTKEQYNGYLCLCLRNCGAKWISVHRLVAQAFLPNPENKPQVDHIDGNKENNCVENLRWVTAAENAANPLWVERSKNVSKETRQKMSNSAHKIRKKPIVQYDLDGNLIGYFDSSIVACNLYGFSQGHILEALNGKRKQAYGYIWKYKKEVAA